jgi:hypothetical protein
MSNSERQRRFREGRRGSAAAILTGVAKPGLKRVKGRAPRPPASTPAPLGGAGKPGAA